MRNRNDMCLLITIVRKGWGDKVVEAALHGGAEGATVTFARGTGIHEHQKLLGIPIEPEKEIVFTVILRTKVKEALGEIIRAVELDKPGHGIAFTLPLDNVVGIAHKGDAS
jgi:nitrogen regulatory protein PII